MQESEIIERIQTLCASRGWTFYRLAKESGITYSTLCTMLHKATAPSVSTLFKLCRGFGITMSEFFDEGNQWATLSAAQKDNLALWGQLNETNQNTVEKYMQFLLQQQNDESK